MILHFIEATDGFNWGKFALARFSTEEWAHRSHIDGDYLLKTRGWSPKHLLVLDLQTGEAAIFMPHPTASVKYDLEKHAIWVCPMFEPFLEWLYQQDLTDITTLPAKVEIKGPKLLSGYRRPGKGKKETP